ncbi:aldehyde dehydrogenase family protein, partial [Komagataeibacter xylinus]
ASMNSCPGTGKPTSRSTIPSPPEYARVSRRMITLIRVKDFDDAIAQANNSRYGLSAYMFTQNLRNIMRMTNELNFGEIYVNREGGEAAQGFHHGYGDSGIGGEDGQYGLEAYVDTKTVYLNA